MKYFPLVILLFPLYLTASQPTYSQMDEGNETIHGLKFINEKAVQFMDQYNLKNNTSWVTSEPNAKIVVPKCTVPLQAKWFRLAGHPVNRFWYIQISCDKTVDENYKDWQVKIPTTRPTQVFYQNKDK
ncbi:hypothetical protein [Zophobihabitans entericus]|uniref:Uncharacterized protein n=1 Tax=Zophobihabitans entericus TaxID=1635327 RepID=A0A6G9IBD0_9GAMM|nr:hypothetical protein [Zophobihabitans entericus]QIQ20890.1 hypothetical protein IPMB12_03850 [Zophobihabitans entericus]